MGRRSHSRSLSIWTNGVRVGRWTVPARGEMELQYDVDWVRADVGRPLSLSLPFNLQNLPLKGRESPTTSTICYRTATLSVVAWPSDSGRARSIPSIC